MSFLNPLMLFGALAVSVPILIHLLNRKKFRRVVWGAMRFLQASVEKNKRHLSVQDLLLLLMRCLLILLLAFAFARPALKSAVRLAPSGGPEVAAIVLDNSMSMQTMDGLDSFFQKGVQAAEGFIAKLPAGSSCALFLASDISQPVLLNPTPDFELLRNQLRQSKTVDRGSDLAPALRAAVERLSNRGESTRRIFVVTDGQAEAWKKRPEIQDVFSKARARNIQSEVVLLGTNTVANCSVQSVDFQNIASVDVPLRFDVEVKNWGTAAAQSIPVKLQPDELQVSDEFVIDSIPPGASKVVTLSARFKTAGYHSVRAFIGADRLQADDSRHYVVRVFDSIRVLLVNGTGGTGQQEPVFFLRHALHPLETGPSKHAVEVSTISLTQLSETRLSDYALVIVANAASIPAAALHGLHVFTAQGGSVLFALGDQVDASIYNQQLLADGFLPAQLGAAFGDIDKDDKFFALQKAGFDHPISQVWNDTAAGTVASAHFYRAFELKMLPTGQTSSAPTQVVLSFQDGKPALVEHSFGLGRVFLFASTLNNAWNDFPVRPAYIPLFYRLLAFSIRVPDASLNVSIGDSITHSMSPELLGKSVTLEGMSRGSDRRDYRQVEFLGGLARFRFEGQNKSGLYQITLEGGREKFLCAVNPPPIESNLAPLDTAVVTSLSPLVAFQLGPRPKTGAEALLTSMQEFWFSLLLICAVVAVIETIMSRKFSQPK